MDFILWLIVFFTFFEITNQKSDNNSIIEEGCTLTQDLSQTERCKLSNYAQRLVHLLLAEDDKGDNITDLINNRFEELKIFHDEVVSYFLLVQDNFQKINNSLSRVERLKYFNLHVHSKIFEITWKSCLEQYSSKLYYEYDSKNKIISIRENLSLSPNECLCENYKNRKILSIPPSIPALRQKVRTHEFNRTNNGENFTEVSEYHVIPLSLISEFFQVWLSDKRENYQ